MDNNVLLFLKLDPKQPPSGGGRCEMWTCSYLDYLKDLSFPTLWHLQFFRGLFMYLGVRE